MSLCNNFTEEAAAKNVEEKGGIYGLHQSQPWAFRKGKGKRHVIPRLHRRRGEGKEKGKKRKGGGGGGNGHFPHQICANW